MEKYTLPKLKYGYGDLEPYISEEIMTLHHSKHHQAYVNGANAVVERLRKAREAGAEVDMKSELKTLSFNLNGHLLHSRFWDILGPAKDVAKLPSGKLKEDMDAAFGGWERFMKEFTQAAMSVEGSGWAALVYHPVSGLLIMQIEKHNANCYAGHEILMLVDVWEHAYYLDYKNDRGKYLEGFWNVVDWEEVGKNYGNIKKKYI